MRKNAIRVQVHRTGYILAWPERSTGERAAAAKRGKEIKQYYEKRESPSAQRTQNGFSSPVRARESANGARFSVDSLVFHETFAVFSCGKRCFSYASNKWDLV